MPENEVGDEEFMALAKDQARARALRTSMQRLAGQSGNGALQEMAREVLSGRVGLREALQVGAYREALQEKARAGMRAIDGMSAAERGEAEAEGQRQLDAYQAEIDQEQSERGRMLGRGGASRSGPGKHSGEWRP
ncbi:hypothetical protein Stsp01_58140 [Streptomyces sp. NBRC 13847]|uniref:hypothetical protein n=1 Tax=Streptomyces TaxID=1883 RepID=UPI0024A3DECF|nr:hypothetical protein [Streptomyces sp. NBRC 13847]GLW19071.1 hypothetical protein Stsp01_58140 [Streptomyces sp. NBRC 13847]